MNSLDSRLVRIRHVAGAERPPSLQYDADVVILAFDRAEETEAAIRSALGQTGVSRHVIVVDQGSRPEALTRLAEAVRDRDDAHWSHWIAILACREDVIWEPVSAMGG